MTNNNENKNRETYISEMTIYDGLGSTFTCALHLVHYEMREGLNTATEGYVFVQEAKQYVPVRYQGRRWYMAHESEVSADTLNAMSYARIAYHKREDERKQAQAEPPRQPFGELIYKGQDGYAEYQIAELPGVRMDVCLEGTDALAPDGMRVRLFRIEWQDEKDSTYWHNKAEYTMDEARATFYAHARQAEQQQSFRDRQLLGKLTFREQELLDRQG